MRRRSPWSLIVVLALLSSGCAAVAAPPMEPVASTTFVGAAHNDTSTPFNLVHLPRLIRHRYDGRALRIRHVVSDGLAVTRHHVTYRSGPLRISGQLSVPRRPGRFPLLVLAHGYQNPATYRTGASLAREAAHLASHGYVVLQPDYRNHGESDRDTARDVARPLGYPEDLVNAIRAVRRADLPFVDGSRVGVFGRSMGGGVALNAVAARPGLVDALVLYSPLSSRAGDNYRRWVVGRPHLDRKVRAAYGRPVDNPGFWNRASSRRFAHRVDVPVQVHHGTADAVCPVRWSGATVAALRRAGQTVEYHRYLGEGHRFDEAWPVMADRVVRFFDAHV